MNMAPTEARNEAGGERCVSYGRGGAGNLCLLARFPFMGWNQMLTGTPGRPSERRNSEGVVDMEDQKKRRSSVWSTTSSNGEGRRASIVKAAAMVLRRRSSTGDEEVETKGEE